MKIKTIKTYLIASFMLSASLPAWSGPLPLHLDDFHRNCDIRALSLSQEQHQELKKIRNEYRRLMSNAAKRNKNSSSNRNEIIRILSAVNFDIEAAKNYIVRRDLANIDASIYELRGQHQFFQLLTPSQRTKWLNTCLK